jgi:hypothetical protein
MSPTSLACLTQMLGIAAGSSQHRFIRTRFRAGFHCSRSDRLSCWDRFFFQGLPVFVRIAGVFVILMGLATLGVLKIPFLYREKRLSINRMRAGPAGAVPLGMAFASVGHRASVPSSARFLLRLRRCRLPAKELSFFSSTPWGWESLSFCSPWLIAAPVRHSGAPLDR